MRKLESFSLLLEEIFSFFPLTWDFLMLARTPSMMSVVRMDVWVERSSRPFPFPTTSYGNSHERRELFFPLTVRDFLVTPEQLRLTTHVAAVRSSAQTDGQRDRQTDKESSKIKLILPVYDIRAY